MVKVRTAEALVGYKLAVRFSDGTRGVVDFRPFLRKAPFRRLKNEKAFRGAVVEHGAVEWPESEVGIATEALYAVAHGLPKPSTRAEADQNELEVGPRVRNEGEGGAPRSWKMARPPDGAGCAKERRRRLQKRCFIIRYEPEVDGSWSTRVTELYSVNSQGKSLPEARARTIEALETLLEKDLSKCSFVDAVGKRMTRRRKGFESVSLWAIPVALGISRDVIARTLFPKGPMDEIRRQFIHLENLLEFMFGAYASRYAEAVGARFEAAFVFDDGRRSRIGYSPARPRVRLSPGQMVKIVRELQGATQARLAKLSYVSKEEIVAIEAGRMPLSALSARKLAMPLRVDPMVFGWVEEWYEVNKGKGRR